MDSLVKSKDSCEHLLLPVGEVEEGGEARRRVGRRLAASSRRLEGRRAAAAVLRLGVALVRRIRVDAHALVTCTTEKKHVDDVVIGQETQYHVCIK